MATVVEPYKSKYTVERSFYKAQHGTYLVHLRMISPDNGKTHVEYYSYTTRTNKGKRYTTIENEEIMRMEESMDKYLLMHKLNGIVKGIDALNKNFSKAVYQTKLINSIC